MVSVSCTLGSIEVRQNIVVVCKITPGITLIDEGYNSLIYLTCKELKNESSSIYY